MKSMIWNIWDLKTAPHIGHGCAMAIKVLIVAEIVFGSIISGAIRLVTGIIGPTVPKSDTYYPKTSVGPSTLRWYSCFLQFDWPEFQTGTAPRAVGSFSGCTSFLHRWWGNCAGRSRNVTARGASQEAAWWTADCPPRTTPSMRTAPRAGTSLAGSIRKNGTTARAWGPTWSSPVVWWGLFCFPKPLRFSDVVHPQPLTETGHPGRLGTLVQELGRPVKDLKKVTSRSKAMAACYPGHGARYVKHVDNDENHPLCRTRLLTALILGVCLYIYIYMYAIWYAFLNSVLFPIFTYVHPPEMGQIFIFATCRIQGSIWMRVGNKVMEAIGKAFERLITQNFHCGIPVRAHITKRE